MNPKDRPASESTDGGKDLFSITRYIQGSPTPYHATASTVAYLEDHGFIPLQEESEWNLEPGQRYYCTRNHGSLIAFTYQKPTESSFIKMVGAHTDSPCLKVLPDAIKRTGHYVQLKVSAYGGVLLHPWFDRDLSLAGKVTYLDSNNKLCSCLIDLEKPIACIPSLAIHLNRSANESSSVNVHEHMAVLISAKGLGQGSSDAEGSLYAEGSLKAEGSSNAEGSSKAEGSSNAKGSSNADKGSSDKANLDSLNDLIRSLVINQYPDRDCMTVLNHDLCFYDTQAPAYIGLESELFAGARLDNLVSCYAATKSLIDALGAMAKRQQGQHMPDHGMNLLVFNDHEEVGSNSDSGAAGPFLEQVLERLIPEKIRARVLRQSLLFSVDNAHALHPNYLSKHEGSHAPLLNHGPVIKYNANQRYATTAETAALAKVIASQAEPAVPLQHFAVRPDMACGSTIGPISATRLGVRTLDLGVPTFAMHSVRELAGAHDIPHLTRLLSQFFLSSKEDCAVAAIV